MDHVPRPLGSCGPQLGGRGGRPTAPLHPLPVGPLEGSENTRTPGRGPSVEEPSGCHAHTRHPGPCQPHPGPGQSSLFLNSSCQTGQAWAGEARFSHPHSSPAGGKPAEVWTWGPAGLFPGASLSPAPTEPLGLAEQVVPVPVACLGLARPSQGPGTQRTPPSPSAGFSPPGSTPKLQIRGDSAPMGEGPYSFLLQLG